MKKTIFSALIVVFIGSIVFGQGLNGDFVWDDIPQIVENPLFDQERIDFKTLITSSTFGVEGFSEPIGGYYKPLMTFIFLLIGKHSNMNPWYFHAVQISIHIVNAILLLALLHTFTKKWKHYNITAILIASLIFLIHPIQTETTVHISTLQDVLFVMFGLFAFLAYLSIKNSYVRYPVTMILILFSLLSKETGILFIVILGIYTYGFEKRNLKIYIGSIVALLAGYIILRCGISNTCAGAPGDVYGILSLPFLQFLLHMPSFHAHYLTRIFYPNRIAINEFWVINAISLNNFYIPLISTIVFYIVVFIIIAKLIQRKYLYLNYVIFFMVWFFAGLWFHMHIVPLDFTASDRWLYFSMVGLSGLIAITLLNLSQKSMLLLSIPIVTLFGFITYSLVPVFNSNTSIFTYEISQPNTSYQAYNNYGVIAFNDKNLNVAEEYFEKSLMLASDWPVALTNLATIKNLKGETDTAIQLYRRALNNDRFKKYPYYPAYEGAIKVLLSENRKIEAEELYLEATQVFDTYESLAVLINEYESKND